MNQTVFFALCTGRRLRFISDIVRKLLFSRERTFKNEVLPINQFVRKWTFLDVFTAIYFHIILYVNQPCREEYISEVKLCFIDLCLKQIHF